MNDQLPRGLSLSLLPRLLLAVLAGLPIGYAFPQWEYAILLEGVLLGLFVPAPALKVGSMLFLRLLVAIVLGGIGAVALFYGVVMFYEFGSPIFDGFSYIASPFIVTVTLLLLFARLSGRTITQRFLGWSLITSLCAGLSFYVFVGELWSWLCFDSCPWWNELAFSAGWCVWHVAIASAVSIGSDWRQVP